MKITLVTILLILTGANLKAQNSAQVLNTDALDTKVNYSSPTNTVYSIPPMKLPNCPYTVENAINDIKVDSMSIIIHGGFQGFGNMDERLSSQFQKKYTVVFEYLGCMRFWDIKTEDTHGYNDIIFAYLIDKYGSIVKTEFDQIWIEE